MHPKNLTFLWDFRQNSDSEVKCLTIKYQWKTSPIHVKLVYELVFFKNLFKCDINKCSIRQAFPSSPSWEVNLALALLKRKVPEGWSSETLLGYVLLFHSIVPVLSDFPYSTYAFLSMQFPSRLPGSNLFQKIPPCPQAHVCLGGCVICHSISS